MTDNRALWELVEKWREPLPYDKYGERTPWEAGAKKGLLDAAKELVAILERPVVVGDSWKTLEQEDPKFEQHCLVAHRVGRKVIVSEAVRWGYRPGKHDDEDPMSHWQVAGSDDYPDVIAWMPMPVAPTPESLESMVRGKS